MPAEEKVLDATHRTALDDGWYDFPGLVRLSAPGCYGFQIDTAAGPAASSQGHRLSTDLPIGSPSVWQSSSVNSSAMVG